LASFAQASNGAHYLPLNLHYSFAPDLFGWLGVIYKLMLNHFPSHLPDDELAVEVERLARCAREATTGLVAHLAEFDARRLYRGAGYPSLFAYCTERLHISEYGAYNRMEAARAARRLPVILQMLSDGSLNLATVRILAPHLTSENHLELLDAARGRSKREVEQLIARHFPRPAVPTLVRKLPARRGWPPLADVAAVAVPKTTEAGPDESSLLLPAQAWAANQPATPEALAVPSASPAAELLSPPAPAASAPPRAATLPPAARPTVTPLAPDRYQIRFTASAETYRKLCQAQELLGHGVPSGDVAVVVDRALSALVAELTRKKVAATDRPRAARKSPSDGSRHVPAQVRRTVWRRDGGRCAFVASGGLRCSARKPLEFHHVHPYGAGGEATVGNIELRCRSHNAYEAELFYGFERTHRGNGIVREPSAQYGSAGRGNSPRGELGP
jgi:hypothetical protein